MNLLVSFIIFNIINVILQTVKSLCTVKCGKTVAAIANALCYGLYTYIIILCNCELSILLKCFIVGGCNLIGVFVVKVIEEKLRKDKLWKIEVTCPMAYTRELIDELSTNNISFNTIPTWKDYTQFNIFCPTQNESEIVKRTLKKYSVKYFVSESKVL